MKSKSNTDTIQYAYTYEGGHFSPLEIKKWKVINGKMPYGRHGHALDCPDIRKFCDNNHPWGATPAEAIEIWLKDHEKQLRKLQNNIKHAKADLERSRNQNVISQ